MSNQQYFSYNQEVNKFNNIENCRETNEERMGQQLSAATGNVWRLGWG
jgi:hypothetical protein